MKNNIIGRAKINFGKVALWGTRRINACDVEMELRVTGGEPTFTMNGKERVYTGKYTPRRLEFSVCGNVWNNLHTDIVMGGQYLDDMPVKNPRFAEIRELWRKYHLNTMHAGTPRQEYMVRKWEAAGNRYEYKAVCEYLDSIGLRKTIWDGKDYEYGHGWLYFPIPRKDLKRIVEIMREYGNVSDAINEWVEV